MVHAPSISLKVIFVTHLILTAWATMMNDFMPVSYIYLNAFMLVFGVFSIINPEQSEALLMFLIINLSAIVTDIIYLGVFTGRYGHAGYMNEFRFCLAMAIINLLIRPVSSFILLRLYQERNGQYSDFGIPGLPGFSQAGSPRGGGYENIDQPVPSNNIESASPHSTIDKSPIP